MAEIGLKSIYLRFPCGWPFIAPPAVRLTGGAICRRRNWRLHYFFVPKFFGFFFCPSTPILKGLFAAIHNWPIFFLIFISNTLGKPKNNLAESGCPKIRLPKKNFFGPNFFEFFFCPSTPILKGLFAAFQNWPFFYIFFLATH